MGTRKREIVEFAGLNTYFFPNIAIHAEFNDELLTKKPEEANPVAAFLFGATKKRPSEQEIVDIIFPDNANPETIYTGLDTSLALGGRFLSQFKSLDARLKMLKHTHDLSEVIEADDKKRLAVIGRKARLQKGLAAKILWILVKIIMAEDEERKYLEICELCSLNLDFDAYVLIKLLGMETEARAEEVDIIKGNVMTMLKKPELVELMKNGPMSEINRILISAPIEKSAQKLAYHFLDLYKANADAEDDYSSVKERRLQCQLVFLILRSIASDNPHVAKQIMTWIPYNTRREMFPGLQMNRAEKTIDFAHSVITRFTNSIVPSFKGWSLVGINDYVDNPWSRRAIINILDNFRFVVTRRIFDQVVPLVPISQLPNSVLVEKFEDGLRCASWIIEHFGKFDEKAIETMAFLRKCAPKQDIVKDIQKALEQDSEDPEDAEIVLGVAHLTPQSIPISFSPKSQESSEVSLDVTQESSEDDDQTEFLNEVSEKLVEWNHNSISQEPIQWKRQDSDDWLGNNLNEALSPKRHAVDDGSEGQEVKKMMRMENGLKIQNASDQNAKLSNNNSKRSSMAAHEERINNETPKTPPKNYFSGIPDRFRTINSPKNSRRGFDKKALTSLQKMLDDHNLESQLGILNVSKPISNDSFVIPEKPKLPNLGSLKSSNTKSSRARGPGRVSRSLPGSEKKVVRMREKIAPGFCIGNPFAVKRRLFGGVGCGETPQYKGYI